MICLPLFLYVDLFETLLDNPSNGCIPVRSISGYGGLPTQCGDVYVDVYDETQVKMRMFKGHMRNFGKITTLHLASSNKAFSNNNCLSIAWADACAEPMQQYNSLVRKAQRPLLSLNLD